MTIQDTYFTVTSLLVGAGTVAAAISLGWASVAAIVMIIALCGLGLMALSAETVIAVLIVVTVALVVLGHLRLGWLARRRPGWWAAGLPLMALLAALGIAGLPLMAQFPGQGYLANLGYYLAMLLLTAPAVASLGLGLAGTALSRPEQPD